MSRSIHSSPCRRVQKRMPRLEASFRKAKKRPVGSSWRMGETHIEIRGRWMYLYRAVDKDGQRRSASC